jgi:hypothetical protein
MSLFMGSSSKWYDLLHNSLKTIENLTTISSSDLHNFFSRNPGPDKTSEFDPTRPIIYCYSSKLCINKPTIELKLSF